MEFPQKTITKTITKICCHDACHTPCYNAGGGLDISRGRTLGSAKSPRAFIIPISLKIPWNPLP